MERESNVKRSGVPTARADLLGYFGGYRLNSRKLELKKYELDRARRDFDSEAADKIRSDIQAIECEMAKIEAEADRFSLPRSSALDSSDERLFIRCRYILGMTYEQTAEAMNVSRSTVFRIRKRIFGN